MSSSADARKPYRIRPQSSVTSFVDPLVFYTFLAVLLIGSIILFLQLDKRQACAEIKIAVNGQWFNGQHFKSSADIYTIGEVITFDANIMKGSSSRITWSFGDSTSEQHGYRVHHTFNRTGDYTVTLRSGGCSWNREIAIYAMPDKVASVVADVYPVINGPSEVFAN